MNTSPRWFGPAAIAALVWNLLGCAAYLADVKMSPERLSSMTAAQQALYAARPWWAVAATATAVWVGAAGCLGLILRRKWSTWLLIVSLAGVVVQDLWLFVLSGSAREVGAVAFVMQGLVLVVSIGLVLLARRAAAEGWLT
ncbi:MAG TPA: hypothetical protein VNL96_03300 [Gemmatimonadaceae bacterium]|nr:hypothetical protein [Gemmatimonadaceae bacterium]